MNPLVTALLGGCVSDVQVLAELSDRLVQLLVVRPRQLSHLCLGLSHVGFAYLSPKAPEAPGSRSHFWSL